VPESAEAAEGSRSVSPDEDVTMPTLPNPTTARADYRYEHFQLRHMLADLRFDPAGPGPGDRLPGFRLLTIDGETIDLEALDRPHLFVFGSNTCPMTAAAASPLERLRARFGDEVRFVLVQVREAHPGEHLGQAESFEEKVAQARRLRVALGIDLTVAVDELDGRFHTSLDPKPNAAYLVDQDGVIRFRSLWGSDERGLRRALESVTTGVNPAREQSTRMLAPMLAALGYLDGILRTAGPRAARDLARSAPPMLLGARLASVFGRLRPERRGLAVVAVTVSLVIVVGFLIVG
jgi:hypothetical protein